MFNFGLGDALGTIANLGEDAFDVVESVGDLAGDLAPIVSAFNPIAGIGLQAFSSATDFAEKFGFDMAVQQRTDDSCGSDKKKDRRGGCEGSDGSGGFFTELARVLGKTVDDTANELLGKAKELQAASDSKDKTNFFTLSAEVQGLSQELKVGGDMISNVLQSAGGAADKLVQRG